MKTRLLYMRVSAAVAIAVAITETVYAESYVRFDHNGETKYGTLEDDSIAVLSGDFLYEHERTGESVPLADVQLLAPVQPVNVVAVGFNYASHGGERDEGAVPPIFLKQPGCIVGPDAPIVIPEGAKMVHYEGEMVAVIGKTCKNVSVEDASDYVFGVTAGNDVSARLWQQTDLQWFRGKAVDTWGPIGPAVVTGLDYDDLLMTLTHKGRVGQQERTSNLIFNTAEIVSFVSQYMTLHPGDVIFTGTPGGTKALRPGDVVEVEVEGVGVLSNPVVAEE